MGIQSYICVGRERSGYLRDCVDVVMVCVCVCLLVLVSPTLWIGRSGRKGCVVVDVCIYMG